MGRPARIELVDRATATRGFILLDQVTLADEPATSGKDRADWVDWGRDFYASITYENLPDDRRLLVGWMSNWLYASAIPTSPWRSTQSEPRELSLRRTGGEIELVQEPARELRRLRRLRFASVSRAPLALPRSGRLQLRVLVDHSSVEVFADRGRRVITDQVFPGPASDRVALFAEGGRASVRGLNVWPMESIWFPEGVGGE